MPSPRFGSTPRHEETPPRSGSSPTGPQRYAATPPPPSGARAARSSPRGHGRGEPDPVGRHGSEADDGDGPTPRDPRDRGLHLAPPMEGGGPHRSLLGDPRARGVRLP